MVQLAASILSADFCRLGQQIAAAEAAGADYIHCDVMDGRFVPNITIGPLVVSAVRRATRLPLDVHLMIEQPERYLADFAKAGANNITVHVETCPHLHRTIQQLRELGVGASVTVNPGTPLHALDEILPYVDMVLLMTVNPGFGGQSFIETMYGKIRALREQIDARDLAIRIEVDGGVNTRTIRRVVEAGADVLVAGSAVFGTGDVGKAIADLRAAAG